MTAPPSTPTARELARACVRVGLFGKTKRAVYHVAPGQEDSGLVYVVCDEADVPRMTEALVDLLAPLVDLGLRHREAMQATRDPRPVQRIPSTLRADRHDDDDGDPDG